MVESTRFRLRNFFFPCVLWLLFKPARACAHGSRVTQYYIARRVLLCVYITRCSFIGILQVVKQVLVGLCHENMLVHIIYTYIHTYRNSQHVCLWCWEIRLWCVCVVLDHHPLIHTGLHPLHILFTHLFSASQIYVPTNLPYDYNSKSKYLKQFIW